MAEFTPEQIIALVEAAALQRRCLDHSMRADDEINLSADSGTNDLKFETIKSGRMLVLQHLSGYDDSNNPTRVRVGYWNGHRLNWLNAALAPGIGVPVVHNQEVRLREGMYPVVRFEGATSGDDLYATLNGYWLSTR